MAIIPTILEQPRWGDITTEAKLFPTLVTTIRRGLKVLLKRFETFFRIIIFFRQNMVGAILRDFSKNQAILQPLQNREENARITHFSA